MSFSGVFLNARLYSTAGEILGRPTVLCHHDGYRAGVISKEIFPPKRLGDNGDEDSKPVDCMAFAEVMCRRVFRDFRREFQPTHPFFASSPFKGGINLALAKVKKRNRGLAEVLQRAAKPMTQLTTSLAKRKLGIRDGVDPVSFFESLSGGRLSEMACLMGIGVAVIPGLWQSEVRSEIFRAINHITGIQDEEELISFIQDLVGEQHVLGGGLAFFSRYPFIENPRFIPYEVARGFERLAQKGILKMVMNIPDIGRVTILVTHLQEGNGSELEKVQVRAQQAEHLKFMIEECQKDSLVIVLADLNIIAEEFVPVLPNGFFKPTGEYKKIVLGLLGLQDAYRVQFPDFNRHPGPTYITPVAGSFPVITKDKQNNQRIDYVLIDGKLYIVKIKVLQGNDFRPRVKDPKQPMSIYEPADHRPVIFEIEIQRCRSLTA